MVEILEMGKPIVESGKEALSYIKGELAKSQGKLTRESEARIIRQVQRKFSLSEETAAGLINIALKEYSQR